MSQRLIFAFAVIIDLCNLYLRNITQIYVQFTTLLNQKFYVQPLQELRFKNGAILKIIKFFYRVPEAGAHWFNTYHGHYTKKLSMAQSMYNLCLLYINSNGFGVIKLQTNKTLMLINGKFAAAEEIELNAAKLLAKDKKKLTESHPIKFNGGYIKLQTDSIYLIQENQCKCLKLMALRETDLTGSCS